MPLVKFGLLLLIFLLAVPRVRSQNPLDDLFAPPTPDEIQQILAAWESEIPVTNDWQVEWEGTIVDGFFAQVISHRINGEKHYGVIRFPRHFEPGKSYPVLVYNHGGFAEAKLTDLMIFDRFFLPTTCINDFILMPAYRAARLEMGVAGSYQSEGTASYLDGDVTDSIAFLNGALAHIPEMESSKITAYGESRGASVSLLMAIRDLRIRQVIALYPATDMFLYKDEISVILESGASPENPIAKMLMDTAVAPYIEGKLSLAEARLELIKRSAVYFDLPPVQLHHGVLDNVIPVAQSDRLTVDSYFRYPEGKHSSDTLEGAGTRVESILCDQPGTPVPDYPYGLSPESYAAYMDFLPDEKPVFFNPGTDYEYLDAMKRAAGLYADSFMPDTGERDKNFPFLAMLDSMQFESQFSPEQQSAIQQWRVDKQPVHLKEAGINYLIYSNRWLSYVTPQEYEILKNPDNYTLIETYTHPTTSLIFELYRVNP